MPQEDFILRQIRQLTQILAQVLFRKKNEQYQQALEDIRQAGQLFLGLDLHAIEVLTYEALQEALRVRHAQDAEHVALVAELLHHQGDCFAREGHAEAARQSYGLALHGYLDLFGADAQLPNAIDALLEALDPPLDLPPDTQRLLFRYLDATGRYARAEDALFRLADDAPTDDLLAEGVAFFERLLRVPYRRLKAGNLPYEEVKEGLAAFRKKCDAFRA